MPPRPTAPGLTFLPSRPLVPLPAAPVCCPFASCAPSPQIWVDCGKLVQDLLKNQQTKMYFGEPVRESYVPNYYSVIKNPMDLGTIKSELLPCTA